MKILLFFGEMPPHVVNGISVSNDININILRKYFDVKFVPDRPGNRISKFFFALCDSFKIAYLANKNCLSFFYASYPTSKIGAVKLLLYAFIVKAMSPKTKIVFHLHRGDFNYRYQEDFWYRNVSICVSKLLYKMIVLSDRHRDDISICLPSLNLCVVRNSIREFEFSKAPRNNKIKFLYLSNYLKDKGILNLLEAFSMAKSSGKLENSELHCYGAFLHHEIKDEVIKYNNKNSIYINDVVSGQRKKESFENADVFILPSLNEGQPLSIIEAMYYKCAVISCDVGFIKEMLPVQYEFLLDRCYSVDSLSKMLVLYSQLSIEEQDEIVVCLRDNYCNNFSSDAHEKNLKKAFNCEDSVCK